jgi:hypothetical protein
MLKMTNHKSKHKGIFQPCVRMLTCLKYLMGCNIKLNWGDIGGFCNIRLQRKIGAHSMGLDSIDYSYNQADYFKR